MCAEVHSSHQNNPARGKCSKENLQRTQSRAWAWRNRSAQWQALVLSRSRTSQVQTNLGLCFLPTRSHRFWWLYVLGGLAKCVAQEGTREGCGLCSVSDVTVFSRSSRPSFYKVVLGAHEEDIRGSDVQQLQVNKLFLEPKRADIALLKLARYGFPEVCSQAE